MTRLQNAPRSRQYGGGGSSNGSRFNDGASYVTDTSSVTNPIEFGFSYSNENDGGDDVSFFDSTTSALTGLTGWTSANGKSRAGDMSEFGAESANFPIAHSKSQMSAVSEGAETEVSELASEAISTISFNVNGDDQTSAYDEEVEVMQHTRSYRSNDSRSRGRKPMMELPPSSPRVVQFRSPSISSDSQKSSGYKSKPSGAGAPPVSPTSSLVSDTSGGSSRSKKRAPVPPLRDPNMDDKEEDQMWEEDCNYDINPSLMFLVLESHDWKEAISLLDGKGLENKNDAWNLGHLFGMKKKEDAAELSKKRQRELRAQARTWITRRERNGVLRWRMLPLHAALAFNAPFEVALRLYHLYPGAVRLRNDQGMLPMHHVFKFGNEDKILELLLDVFPEALTVVDDKGRLPLGCTPKDGSDNERRSNILTLFSNFQLELAKKKEVAETAQASTPSNNAPQPQPPGTIQPREESQEGTLGAAPRYTTNTGYNQVTYNSINQRAPLSKKTTQPVPKKSTPKPLQPVDEDDSIQDRYATFSSEDGENVPYNPMGLAPIPEDGATSPHARKALKEELLVLGEKKKRKGFRKLFGK